MATSEYSEWLPSKILGVFTCDLQIPVTDIDDAHGDYSTRLRTYFRNDFRESLPGLFYWVLVCVFCRSAVVLARILVSYLFCLFIHMCSCLPAGEKMSTGRLQNDGRDKCRWDQNLKLILSCLLVCPFICFGLFMVLKERN